MDAHELYKNMSSAAEKMRSECKARLAALDKNAITERRVLSIRSNIASLGVNFSRFSYEWKRENYSNLFMNRRYPGLLYELTAGMDPDELRAFVTYVNTVLWLSRTFVDRIRGELDNAEKYEDIDRAFTLRTELDAYNDLFAAWEDARVAAGLPSAESVAVKYTA